MGANFGYFYEHIMGPILDQNRTGEGVCRRADVGRLPEIIEESAIAKKFPPPIFSPPLPGRGVAGPKWHPVPRNRARGNATARRTPQEGISTGRTGPPGTGGASVFNLKTRGGREAESRKGAVRKPFLPGHKKCLELRGGSIFVFCDESNLSET